MRAAVILVAGLAALGCGPARLRMPGPSDLTRIERLRMGADRALGPGTSDVGLASGSGFGAWAWPGGRIRVSAAMVDVLDGDELAAVLAHEVGHLQGGTTHPPPAAVAGDDPRADEAEMRADAAGCAILAARGIPPAAMVRMLRQLARHARLDLSARTAAAERTCGDGD